MKVVHLSQSDCEGGAAIAARRLHLGLRAIGIDSTMLVGNKKSGDPWTTEFAPQAGWRAAIDRRLRNLSVSRERSEVQRSRVADTGVFTAARGIYGVEIAEAVAEADILNIHWIAGFADIEEIVKARRGKPIVWTLHDMNPMTGGCHYDFGCGRFATGCGRCPQLGSAEVNDISARCVHRKHGGLRKQNTDGLRLVVPSRWLGEQARQSKVFHAIRVTAIANGLDTETFQPRNRRAARQMLGLTEDDAVLLFVGYKLDDRRKGIDLLGGALESLHPNKKFTLVLVGAADAPFDLSIPVRRVAPTQDERLLSYIYSAADVTLLPSRADNLPNTAIESIACGTPVVACAVGGVAEAVRPGATGALVEPLTAEALAMALSGLLSKPPALEEMRKRCREVALDDYRVDVQAGRYAELYKSYAMGPGINAAAHV